MVFGDKRTRASGLIPAKAKLQRAKDEGYGFSTEAMSKWKPQDSKMCPEALFAYHASETKKEDSR